MEKFYGLSNDYMFKAVMQECKDVLQNLVGALLRLDELAGNEEVFKSMILELKKLSEDEKIKQQMEARADYESRIATARGWGFREGKAEGKIMLLKAQIKDGLITIEKAAEYAEMSVDELKKLIGE